MKLELAEKLAMELMQKHNVSDTQVSFNYNLDYSYNGEDYGAFGITSKNKKNGLFRIELNTIFVELNTYYHVKWLILHEIAHVLAWDKEDHSEKWRQTFIEILNKHNTTDWDNNWENFVTPHRPNTMNGKYSVRCSSLSDYYDKFEKLLINDIQSKPYRKALHDAFLRTPLEKIGTIYHLGYRRIVHNEARKIATDQAGKYEYVYKNKFYFDFSKAYKRRGISKIIVKNERNKTIIVSKCSNFQWAIASALRKIKFIEALEQIAAKEKEKSMDCAWVIRKAKEKLLENAA